MTNQNKNNIPEKIYLDNQTATIAGTKYFEESTLYIRADIQQQNPMGELTDHDKKLKETAWKYINEMAIYFWPKESKEVAILSNALSTYIVQIINSRTL